MASMQNESNVCIFMSVLISFAGEWINQPRNFEKTSMAPINRMRLLVVKPQPHDLTQAGLFLQHSKENEASWIVRISCKHSKPITETAVSWDTITKGGEIVTIKGFIDHGITILTPQRRQKAPLDTSFVITETKMVGNMSNQAWAQLLSYIHGFCFYPYLCLCMTYDGKGIIQQKKRESCWEAEYHDLIIYI